MDSEPKRRFIIIISGFISWVAQSLGLPGQFCSKPNQYRPLPDSEATPIPHLEHDLNAPPTALPVSEAPPSQLLSLAPPRADLTQHGSRFDMKWIEDRHSLYGMDLKRYGSKAELYQNVDIVIECKSFMKDVLILRGKWDDTYIMATEDPIRSEGILVHAHQVLGGFGQGKLGCTCTASHGCPHQAHYYVPWSLPQGDQTVVSCRQEQSKMYHVLRELDHKGWTLDIVGLGQANRTLQYHFPDDCQDVSGQYPPKYTWMPPSSTCALGFHLRETQQEPYDFKNCFAPGWCTRFTESQQDPYAG